LFVAREHLNPGISNQTQLRRNIEEFLTVPWGASFVIEIHRGNVHVRADSVGAAKSTSESMSMPVGGGREGLASPSLSFVIHHPCEFTSSIALACNYGYMLSLQVLQRIERDFLSEMRPSSECRKGKRDCHCPVVPSLRNPRCPRGACHGKKRPLQAVHSS
jgi:hypothetical protein